MNDPLCYRGGHFRKIEGFPVEHPFLQPSGTPVDPNRLADNPLFLLSAGWGLEGVERTHFASLLEERDAETEITSSPLVMNLAPRGDFCLLHGLSLENGDEHEEGK